MNAIDSSASPQSEARDAERPLRIALFTETFLPKIDGVVTRLCQTIRHLQLAGHQVVVIAPDGGVAAFEGARVHGVPGLPFPLYPDIKLAVPRPSIGKALAAFRPDLIHAAHPMLLGASAFYYSSRLRVPLVVSYHAQIDRYLHYYGLGRLEPLFWKGTRSAYNGADLVLCTSQAMKDLLQAQGIQRVELWQRGVDTEFFIPNERRSNCASGLRKAIRKTNCCCTLGAFPPKKELRSANRCCRHCPEFAWHWSATVRIARSSNSTSPARPRYFAGYLKGA